MDPLDRLAQLDLYPLWRDLPTLTDQVDPFDFRQRLAVYKLLMDATNAHSLFGVDNAYNMFWGYVFQLEWQMRSGRLTLPTTPEGRIDANSVWGYGNYALSIIPLIAAIRCGMIAPVGILAPDASDFEYAHNGQIPPLFVNAVGEWQRFYGLLDAAQPGSHLEPLRVELWRAHFASLTAIEPSLHRVGLKYSSQNELDFLLGWVRMVDFLGVAAWRTDLIYMLDNGLGWLPERVLTDDDVPGQSPDMHPKVNGNVKNVVGLTRQSKWRFAFNLWLWKRAMRTKAARAEVLPMLDATFNPSPENVEARRRLFRYVIAL